VFCSPVSKASFGITLLEAMASGKPIVATDNVGYRDLLGPEEGILVPQDDPEAFAGAILRLLEDERLRSENGQGRPAEGRPVLLDHIVRETIDLYEEILLAR